MSAKDYLKNPFTEWLLWLMRKGRLERRHPGMRFRYLAKAQGCRFGRGNVINERSVLVDCELGDYSYVSQDCLIGNATIGKFCSIGPFTRMGLGLHPLDGFVSTHPAFYSARGQAGIAFAERDYVMEKARIEIGNDVWIGANAVIKDGVKIGHGAVIAAGAVVAADVAPYVIVGGIPAKPIRNRFPPDVVERLIRSAWWDKDENWLRVNCRAFHDVQAFLSGPGRLPD